MKHQTFVIIWIAWARWAAALATEHYPIISAYGPRPVPSQAACSEEYTCFARDIRRVAVIGAGPAGLQAAAALLEHGKDVRLFERTRGPGGNWNWSPTLPIPASFP